MLFRSNDTATTEIYTSSHTLSLHDALPISVVAIIPANNSSNSGADSVPNAVITCAPCPDTTSHRANAPVSEIITKYFMRG